MRSLPLFLLTCTAALLSATCAFAADDASDTIAFRYVAADEAFSAVKEQVGQPAAAAVSSIDMKKNAIVLDPTHPQVMKVREFLHSFDYRRPTVSVHATIKKVTPATATTPATEQVLSRPTIVGKPGSKMNLWSGDDGLQIELVVEADPGDAPRK